MKLRHFSDAYYFAPRNCDELIELQDKMSLSFPESFKLFLSVSNGAAFMGEAHFFRALFSGRQSYPQLLFIYGLEEIKTQTEIFQAPNIYDDAAPALAPGMIVIGEAVDSLDQGPVILDLRKNAPQPGAVYFRHLRFSHDQAGVSWFDALAWVAPSFEAFLDSLHEIDE